MVIVEALISIRVSPNYPVCSQPSTPKTKLKEKKMNNNHKSKQKAMYSLVYGGMTGALYTVLTLAFAPVALGPVQFRVSEALCILPYFTPAAIPGITIGCFLSNLILGAAVPDIVFGSLATLIGGFLSYRLRKYKLAVCLPPILSNTIIIPWVLKFAYGIPDFIPFMMLTVGIGEVLAVGVLGNLLLFTLERYKKLIFRPFAA